MIIVKDFYNSMISTAKNRHTNAFVEQKRISLEFSKKNPKLSEDLQMTLHN